MRRGAGQLGSAGRFPPGRDRAGRVRRGVKALLLAAGEGRRLRPLTADRPKPMVPVAGTPMVAYGLAWLRANGVTEAALNTHYKPESLMAFVGDGSAFGLSVRYSREAALLGSSGALVPLRGFLAGEDPFLVVYGDVLTDLRLESVLAAHRRAKADATIVLTQVDDPRRAGMVELDWARGCGSLFPVAGFRISPSTCSRTSFGPAAESWASAPMRWSSTSARTSGSSRQPFWSTAGGWRPPGRCSMLITR